MEKVWIDFILNILPFLVLVFFWIFMMRNTKWGSFGKWHKIAERQLELHEMHIQTLKETNELLKRLLASR